MWILAVLLANNIKDQDKNKTMTATCVFKEISMLKDPGQFGVNFF
jgi:hypothetical protein